MVVLIGLVLRPGDVARNGFGNEYYSAGRLSMTRSLRNFVYNAFDPGGILAMDKPPLALWAQAISARLFGFTPLSVLVPQVADPR
jgi:4-amino-4-deoxy-L-arabinose transferase-like glycosyltransferase